MAWNPQGGGPWGGGGNGGSGGPWGGGGGSGGGGGGGPQRPVPPDIEEVIKKSQDRLKNFLPGGPGSVRGLFVVIIAALLLWGATGFYRVQPGEIGVELAFGKYVRNQGPGLNYWFPAPIGEVIIPNVEETRTITIGYAGTGGAANRKISEESLMLTGDRNIIDVQVSVQWRISDPAAFLFNISEQEATVKAAAESALREVIGRTPLDKALTDQRDQNDVEIKKLLQEILDGYNAGIEISTVKQQEVNPPDPVIEAFNDVVSAQQDKERSENEAIAYRNDIVPKARGEAERVTNAAEAYKQKVTRDAEGEANRFLSVLLAYRTGEEVTTQRLYLERMEDVLGRAQKVIIDSSSKGGSGVVPYLPLPEIQKRSQEGSVR